MSLEPKADVISRYQSKPSDTGSTAVQVALLTHRIANLTTHLKAFKKDVHTRRGLGLLVSRRRRLLKYLKRKNNAAYLELISSLGIRAI